MSYKVSAPQAALFGFKPLYAFDEFTVEHPQVASELKRESFHLFMDISDKESEIRRLSRDIVTQAHINVESFCQKSKARRAAAKQHATLYPTPSPSQDDEDENGHGDNAALEAENERLREENRLMKDELERLRAENAALREERCPSCADMQRDVAVLQDELRLCQSERDRWRGRCKGEERGDSQAGARERSVAGPGGKRKADDVIVLEDD